ncbi:hypothetical protein DSO57_1035471 [Entomophthora muscae]|uniref:Uncharacterized protein n=1 Tax=Entomophthora muscae TaxID=34485 RepID=A0ACC2UK26_9FUNG|nr:hypothetical protein DSO57_1035471 [Entomophthora muscae]
MNFAFGDSLIDRRLTEARMYNQKEYIPVLDVEALKKPAGFFSSGWTLPGVYPKLSNQAAWVKEALEGVYELPERANKTCLSEKNSSHVTEICYAPRVSSFWWGESLKISRKLGTITKKYHIFLLTPDITVEKKLLTNNKEEAKYITKTQTFLPYPWKTYSILSSQVLINNSLPGGLTGFFWFKPLYWAVYYYGHKITLLEGKTISRKFNVTLLYPVSRTGSIEGIIGFEEGASDFTDYIVPNELQFFPIN